jgi:hypothetical protein
MMSRRCRNTSQLPPDVKSTPYVPPSSIPLVWRPYSFPHQEVGISPLLPPASLRSYYKPATVERCLLRNNVWLLTNSNCARRKSVKLAGIQGQLNGQALPDMPWQQRYHSIKFRRTNNQLGDPLTKNMEHENSPRSKEKVSLAQNAQSRTYN